MEMLPEWWTWIAEFSADHPEFNTPDHQWINANGNHEMRGDCCHAWHCWLALRGIITEEAAAEANRKLIAKCEAEANS